jgi:uncharacterized RDD family membrane protein YckC
VFEHGDPEQRDQLNIATPEQVDLRFSIAGIGSRFLAVLTDSIIQIVAEILLILLFVLFTSASQLSRISEVSDTAGKWLIAAIVLFHFLLYWGYFALFEAYWNGQTPGKRVVKIRVIKDSGRQITLFEGLARNLLRVVDMLPQFYLIGVVSMLCNRQHKRLGDFVAGTIVVHERPSEQPATTYSSRSITASIHPPVNPVPERMKLAYDPPADAVARLRPEDLSVIDSFLARALDFDLTTRAQIANRIATSMFARMNVPIPLGVNPERALEAIVYRMRAQSRF